MKYLITNTFKTLGFFESKTLLNSIKNNSKISLYTKYSIFILLFNLLTFLPLFFIYNKAASSLLFLTLTAIIISLLIIRLNYLFKRKDILEKKIVNNSLIKDDLINFAKHNISYNFKIGSLLAFLIFSYSFFVHFILLWISPGYSVSKFIIINILYFASIFLVIYLISILYYFTNTGKKQIFFKISSKKNTGLYKRSNWVYYLNKLNSRLQASLKKININNLLIFRRSIKILYPILIFIGTLVLLSLLNNNIDLSIKIRMFISMIFSLFFTFPVIKTINKNESINESKNPFTLTVIIFFMALLLLSISSIKLNITITEGTFLFSFSGFILPLIEWVNSFAESIRTTANSLNILIIIILPILFFLLFYVFIKIYDLFKYISKNIDFKLKQDLSKKNPSIIFGDSISLYPFLYSLLGNGIIILLLNIELQPISEFFYNLFTTFQVSEIFKLSFLEYNNIYAFFKTIFYIFISITILKLTLQFFSSILSHFILLNDEIIFYENKIYKKTILRVPLSRINYVICKQNILERILDIGTIYIETVDKNGIIKIKGIPSLQEKNVLIMDKIKSDI